jgi:DNA mismatch endonuclease, patch repair protein
MSVARRRDTGPEVRVRRLLHKAGLRYRVVYPILGQRRRTIDIAFTRQKVAVFIDGCFWHSCPQHGTTPRANATWWQAKLTANHERDADTDRMLSEVGWVSLRFWEHEPPEQVVARVAALVKRTR